MCFYIINYTDLMKLHFNKPSDLSIEQGLILWRIITIKQFKINSLCFSEQRLAHRFSSGHSGQL